MIEARARIKGNNYDFIEASAKNKLTFGAGELNRFLVEKDLFPVLEVEKDLIIEIRDVEGIWTEVWSGLIYDPEIDLSSGDITASCIGKGYTTKLLGISHTTTIYYDEIGNAAKTIMEANGFTADNVEVLTEYKNNFTSQVDNWTEETEGSWELDSGEYSGNDGALDRTTFDNLTSLTNYEMKANVLKQSGTDFGFLMRYQDANNYYRFQLGSTLNVFVNIAGTEVLVGQFGMTGWSDTDTVVKVFVDGDTFAVAYGNNAPAIFRDSAFSSGTFGFYVDNSHAHFDNLEVFDARDIVQVISPVNEKLIDTIFTLRTLRFIRHPDGFDFFLDKNDDLHFVKRDFSEPVVAELTEGVNINGGRIFRDFESVRTKIILWGTTIESTFPWSIALNQFCSNMAGSWDADGSWFRFINSGSGILGEEEESQSTTEAEFPIDASQRTWALDASEFTTVKITLNRSGLNDTNWSWHLVLYEDAGTFQDIGISATNLPFGVETEITTTITLNEVNWVAVWMAVGSIAGVGNKVNATMTNLHFVRATTDVKIVAEDTETEFSTREFEDVDSSLETFERGSQFAQALRGLKKVLRWKGQLMIDGDSAINSGKNIKVNMPSANALDQVFRVTEAEHIINADGYQTRITIDEFQSLMVAEFKRINTALAETRRRDLPDDFITKEV